MPVVLESSRDTPGLLVMVPARPVWPGPVPLVVAELLVGPLSEPPLPWLDCAKAGMAANMKAAAKTVFLINYLLGFE
jgi:hypothetical protein